MKAWFRSPRTRQILGLGSLISLLLMIGLNGRSGPLFAFDSQAEPQVQASPLILEQGQRLPITAQMVVGDQTIDLEVARTSEEQAIGLMFRTELAANRGMLFVFEPARPVGFWMKNTLIPLDMLFVYQGRIQKIAAAVPPCKQANCPTYGWPQPIDQVIELQSGRAEALGLGVGDSVEVNFLSQPVVE